jgi:hypothetical protein
VDPVSDQLLLRKSGSAWNRTRVSISVGISVRDSILSMEPRVKSPGTSYDTHGIKHPQARSSDSCGFSLLTAIAPLRHYFTPICQQQHSITYWLLGLRLHLSLVLLTRM